MERTKKLTRRKKSMSESLFMLRSEKECPGTVQSRVFELPRETGTSSDNRKLEYRGLYIVFWERDAREMVPQDIHVQFQILIFLGFWLPIELNGKRLLYARLRAEVNLKSKSTTCRNWV